MVLLVLSDVVRRWVNIFNILSTLVSLLHTYRVTVTRNRALVYQINLLIKEISDVIYAVLIINKYPFIVLTANRFGVTKYYIFHYN